MSSIFHFVIFYSRYYGYRNPGNEPDPRLRVLTHHPYLFENKDILDIGCNIGHITLTVARDLGAKSVLGVDIDPKLIAIARKNVRHYVKKEAVSPPGRTAASVFQCNYILEDDSLLANEQPQFDVILCLSMTKWIHLNWGDAGIKQAFRRMYAQLRPGGKLILEPQNWAGYKKRKKLTETMFKNYNTIEFFPEKFREYLLSPAVGFAKGEILGMPVHRSKGFRRPIQVFTKSTMFPSERIEATPLTSGGYSSAWAKTTEKECVEHVYTDLFDNRYCVCADDNAELNDQIGEELRAELEKRRLKTVDGSSCDMDEDFDNSMPATLDDGDKIQERLTAEAKGELEETTTVQRQTATPNDESAESEVKTVVSNAGGSLVEDNT
nr:unnamed protein product [Callosobruchus chinensis]